MIMFHKYKAQLYVYIQIYVNRGYYQYMKKIKSLKFNGCPTQSHFFYHKDFKTVFVFVLAQLEAPPQKNFGFNGNFNEKMTKINQMAKNHFSGVQNGV